MFIIAICDDEQIIVSQIENILLDYSKRTSLEVDIIVFYSGEELYKYMELGYNFDLIYLDIEMEPMNGLEVGKMIRNRMQNHKTDIVYISGKDGYDRQLFDVQPLHFISKPIDPNNVIEDLKLAMLRANKLGGVFTYKKANESHKVPIKDIIYFESLGRETRIVTVNNEDIFYGVMQKIFDIVGKYQFIRIHRSYIVNYNHISIFRYEEVIMSNGIILPISQAKRKEIKDIQLSIEQEE
ncbi:two component transcriptional regulator, LytTR family [Tissierella praeacuta DSM 18095]|uniref:Two component transcriptional regulator, LytTR family n=1 Tax=Tissierella praeacuta DSM 18095 TaxID=1123404 RepID=A0A1M4XHB0_9FIRM|nr:LytTR family DNA-binding domain-containing protein [Tissierella praeacuta]SHE93067.1 two component transcriptional regulator, LytTR family [Tissierella praeacuta DSM 18095]SUP02105.1 Probable transcriptional regulatory protein YehT [Tissierella praeacuta]